MNLTEHEATATRAGLNVQYPGMTFKDVFALFFLFSFKQKMFNFVSRVNNKGITEYKSRYGSNLSHEERCKFTMNPKKDLTIANNGRHNGDANAKYFSSLSETTMAHQWPQHEKRDSLDWLKYLKL